MNIIMQTNIGYSEIKKKKTPLNQLLKETVNQGVIEAIGDALSIKDTNFKILYQNAKAIKMIGNQLRCFSFS